MKEIVTRTFEYDSGGQLIKETTITEAVQAWHLVIDAKTGRPVVDSRFIDDIVKAIREAERVSGKKLV